MSDDDVRFKCAQCDFETSKRDITELVEHANKAHPEHTFTCQDRSISRGMFGNHRDCWQKQPNGDRTCTYCGSLHEEDFVSILEKYIAGEEGYSFDPSTKDYKSYAHRPGVKNASQGGIKFYHWHVDLSHADLQKRQDLYASAVKRFREHLRERFGS